MQTKVITTRSFEIGDEVSSVETDSTNALNVTENMTETHHVQSQSRSTGVRENLRLFIPQVNVTFQNSDESATPSTLNSASDNTLVVRL